MNPTVSIEVRLEHPAKAQSFGGRLSSRSRRLSPSMEEDLRYVFADVETDAGVKAIVYGSAGSTELVPRSREEQEAMASEDVWGGLHTGGESDGSFIHLFAQERFLAKLESDPRKAKRRRRARAALVAIGERPNGAAILCLLYLHYGPPQPAGWQRETFGDFSHIVEHTPSVAARRRNLARRLADERVDAAELAAFATVGRGDVVMTELAAVETAIRAQLEKARAILTKGERAQEGLLRTLVEERERPGEPRAMLVPRKDRKTGKLVKVPVPKVEILEDRAKRFAGLALSRLETVDRLEARLIVATEQRRSFPADFLRQGPERTAPSARQAAEASIRASADREVTVGAALRDLIRSASAKKISKAALVRQLKAEADTLLGDAEDAYRDTFVASGVAQ